MKGITLDVFMRAYVAADGTKKAHGLWKVGGCYYLYGTRTIPKDTPLSSVKDGFFLPVATRAKEARHD